MNASTFSLRTFCTFDRESFLNSTGVDAAEKEGLECCQLLKKLRQIYFRL